MSKCRDCNSCAVSQAEGCLKGTLYWLYFICGGILIEIFVRKCPVCGHRLSSHTRRADGSFKD
jgi:hypothetical protein